MSAAALAGAGLAAGSSIVTITAGPAEGETVASNSATFSFQSNTQATFQCTLDGGTAESCDSGHVTYTGLANGPHRFDVIATTTGADVVSGSDTRNWTVAVAPVATITSQPPNPSESPDATFAFTSDQQGSTFECALDGATPTSCTSPATYTGLSEREHVFSVRAVDPKTGNGPTAEYRWVVKAPPPTSIETTIAAGPPDPSASPDATFSFAASISGATFECTLNGGTAKHCTSPVTYSGLAAGRHTFTVAASSGNLVDDTPAEYSWTIALPVALDTTITSKPSNPSSSSKATFEFTSNRSEATFECSLNGPAFKACTSPITYEGLSNGSHTFEVRAVRGGTLDTSPARYTWSVEAASSSSSNTWLWIVLAVVAALLIAAVVYYLLMRRRRQQRAAWQAVAVAVPPPERCHGDGEYVLRRDCRLRPARRQVETVALRASGPGGGEIRREAGGDVTDGLNGAVEAWRLRRGRETVLGLLAPAANRLLHDAEAWQRAGTDGKIVVTAVLSGGALDCEFTRFTCVAEGQHRIWKPTDTWRAAVDDEPEEVVAELHPGASEPQALERALLAFVEQVDVSDGPDPSEAPTALSH